jgi:hypothetical protein
VLLLHLLHRIQSHDISVQIAVLAYSSVLGEEGGFLGSPFGFWVFHLLNEVTDLAMLSVKVVPLEAVIL